MQPQIGLTQPLQEVAQSDINLIAQQAATAEDLGLAQMACLAPHAGGSIYSSAHFVDRCVIPYRPNHIMNLADEGPSEGQSPYYPRHGYQSLVEPSAGCVIVHPFRALIGPTATTPAAPLPTELMSGTSAFAAAPTTGLADIIVTPVAPSTSYPRWDLVYAVVTSNATLTSVSRLVKDPTTRVVTSTSVPLFTQTKVTIAIQKGTETTMTPVPGGTTLPSEPSGTHYIPLAYVRIADTFVPGTTQLSTQDVVLVAPTIVPAPASGQASMRPGTTATVPWPTLSKASFSWKITGPRPATYLPPTMTGTETLMIPMRWDIASNPDGTSLPELAAVDNSRDWRNRVWRSQVKVSAVTFGGELCFTPGLDGAGCPQADNPFQQDIVGSGNSFCHVGSGNNPIVFILTAAQVPTLLDTGAAVAIYVDRGTGVLTSHFISGGSGVLAPFTLFIWLEASAPFANY